MDIEMLIASVQERRAIWDAKDKKHSNRDYIKKLWLEIATECGMPSDVAKCKWRGLRENYRKELVKQRTTTGQAAGDNWISKWTYFNSMSFLHDQFTPRTMTGSMGSSEQDDTGIHNTSDISEDQSQDFQNSNQNNDVYEPDVSPSPSGSQQPTNNSRETSRPSNHLPPKQFKRTLLQKMVHLEERKVEQYEKRQRASVTEDADYHFLMSLLPSLRSIPQHRKLAVRRKIEDVFIQEQNSANTSEGPSVSTSPSYLELQCNENAQEGIGQYLQHFNPNVSS